MVLKVSGFSAHAWGARGVYLGSDLSQADWASAVDKALATSVAKNTAIQFGQQIVTWLSSFALMMFLPRYLGPVKYGHIYLAEMLTAMFIVVVQYDGRYSIARRVSRDREHAGDILINSLSFRGILWLVSFAAMMGFAFYAGYSAHEIVILFLFGIEMTWVTARTVISGVFLGGASKYEQKVTDAPSSISIVTADEIKKYGYETLADILRSVRGFYTKDDRNYEYTGMRGIGLPQDYNTRLLLLIDGHRQNDNLYYEGKIDNRLPVDVDLIERIELIRGPSSSIYGTSAFPGGHQCHHQAVP